MTQQSTTQQTLPPFKKINWLARDIALERRADGSMVMRSRVPLQAYAPHIPSLLRHWAAQRPAHTWLAQRSAPGNHWRRLNYADALVQVDALTQALLNLGLHADSPPRPVMILSGNSIEHALLTLAAMQA
ncbi:MAG: AMP-dependent synthetase, partial [Rubrivivax sp.]